MHRFDEEKMAFITPMANYCYKVLPFGLKNARATYQRLLNKVFVKLIGNLMEVYIDDMLIKMEGEGSLLSDLNMVFDCLRQHNMRLNPHKCTFTVATGRFLGFMLTHRGIEANPDKCRVILEMKSPTTVKEVQCLIGRIASLSRFMATLARKALLFFSLLKKGNTFEWTSECEAAFDEFKKYLSRPTMLSKPEAGKPLFLYLSMSYAALAWALVWEDSRQQHPIYFISKALQGPEMRYQKIEKIALALVIAARRLRQYFQAHTIII